MREPFKLLSFQLNPSRFLLGVALFLTLARLLSAAETASLRSILDRAVIDTQQTKVETQVYCASRVPSLPAFAGVLEWQRYADQLRKRVLEDVIFRGEAARWRDARTSVQWLETVPGGPGYRIRKLRYEAVPGLWIPALLYEPETLSGKVPVVLNVNGHDRQGKAAPYKQIRCINLAKRGMLALNLEWFGMGQLAAANFNHSRANQLDLCGTSGVALHYLYLKRAIDLALSLENADPRRLAVTGLSGGGWQTIFISSLDPRVSLANPVAGYSSYLTRTQFPELDLGDSEQTPTDLAAVADYAHLTALMAPRPTLLTYNAKDDCCFRADYAVGPLLAAASTVFRLYSQEDHLRYHISHDAGHNYAQGNREALYRMLGGFFYPKRSDFEASEISSDEEIKREDELYVPLPGNNADFHTLALALSEQLPHHPKLPTEKASALEWQDKRRAALSEIVRAKQYRVEAREAGTEKHGELTVTYWKLRMGGAWTVPAVELVRGESKFTTILVADGGRASAAFEAQRLLAEGHRLLAVDPFYFGESKIAEDDFLFAFLLSGVGDRPLGLQASQLMAAARWLSDQHGTGPVTIVAVGPRSSLFSLIAGALEEQAIGRLELHGAFGSLKEVIEQNLTAREVPEVFCFGLLQAFDMKQLIALVAPRPVFLIKPRHRAEAELADLKDYYVVFGTPFDPLAEPVP